MLAPVKAAEVSLPWSPPALVDPVVVNVGTTQTFLGPYTSGQDVLINMPAQVHTRKLDIYGGHNVRVIGGAIASNDSTDTFMLRFQQLYGSAFVEGMSIDAANAGESDGIEVYGPGSDTSIQPDIYVQNTRILNMHGSLATVHADCFQPQGSVGRVYMDNVTCTTNYQGLFIPPQHPIGSADLRNINLSYTDQTATTKFSYLLWMTGTLGDSTNNCTTYPIKLSNVYANPRDTQNIGTNAVWPKTNQPVGCPSSLSGTTLSFPGLSSYIQGTVTSGTPPGGDFAPAASVGLGYSSPGYDFPTLRGDITGAEGARDGIISLFDTSFVIRNYDTANHPAGDITGPNGVPDGTIDLYDISYEIRNYGG
jgi:hypothetical protein